MATANLLWRELGNLPMLGFSLNYSMTTSLLRGKYERMLREGEEVFQIDNATHSVWRHGPVLFYEAFVWLDYGEPAKALEALEAGIRLLEEKHRTDFLMGALRAAFLGLYCTGRV